jgi:hypothetical protein
LRRNQELDNTAEAIPSGFVPPSAQFLTNVDYSVLRKLGKQNIRMFLWERMAYEREFWAEAPRWHLSRNSGVSCLSHWTYYSGNPCWFTSVRRGHPKTQDFKDDHVRSWLDALKEVKKDAFSVKQVHVIVKKSLRLNLSEKDAEQLIVMLLLDYTDLLKANGPAWVIKDHSKISVEHIRTKSW